MKQGEQSIMISVFLKGNDLDPGEITRLVGFGPTDARRMGETWTTSSNSEVVEKTGRWSFSHSVETRDVAGALSEFLRMFPEGLALGKLPGVTDAFFDIFMIAKYDESGCGEGTLFLDQDCLRLLSDSGLPFEITMAVIRTEDHEI